MTTNITPQQCIATYGINNCLQILIKYPNTILYLHWESGDPDYIDYITKEYFNTHFWEDGHEFYYYDCINTKELQTYMNSHPFVVFGSRDSLDTDILVIVDEPLSSIQQCRELSYSYLPLDANLATVRNGKLTWVFKGTLDEVNNSVLDTYYNLDQFTTCPITKRMFRDRQTKLDRCIRGILSMCSRTQYRTSVKNALKSEDINYKFDILEAVDFVQIKDFPKKGDNKDVYKFIAFQLAQIIGLYRGKEVYTKQKAYNVRDCYDLKSFIYKEDNLDLSILNNKIKLLRELYENNK